MFLHDARLKLGGVRLQQIEGLLESRLLTSGLAEVFLELAPHLGVMLETPDLPFDSIGCPSMA